MTQESTIESATEDTYFLISVGQSGYLPDTSYAVISNNKEELKGYILPELKFQLEGLDETEDESLSPFNTDSPETKNLIETLLTNAFLIGLNEETYLYMGAINKLSNSNLVITRIDGKTYSDSES